MTPFHLYKGLLKNKKQNCLYLPPGPSGLPYISQFCRDCSLVRLWNRKYKYKYQNRCSLIYCITKKTSQRKCHLRIVGFGDSHKRILVATFVRMEFKRQYTVLLLNF